MRYHSYLLEWLFSKRQKIISAGQGASGWLSQLSSNFSSGHDLTVREFEPHIRLSAVHRACFRSSVPLSLCPSHTHALFLTLSKINKPLKIFLINKINAGKVVEKREHVCTICGHVNWYSHL